MRRYYLSRYPFCTTYASTMAGFPNLPVVEHALTSAEPAQQQASNSLLTGELIDVISSPKFNDSRAFLGYTCKLLDLMIAQRRYSQPLSNVHT